GNHFHLTSLTITRAPQSGKKLPMVSGDTSMGLQGKKYLSSMNGANRATPNPPFVSISSSGCDKVDKNKNRRITQVLPALFRNRVNISNAARITANSNEWVKPRCTSISPYLIPKLNPTTSKSLTIEHTSPATSK